MWPKNLKRATAAGMSVGVVAIGAYVLTPHPSLVVVAAILVATVVPTLLLALWIIRTNR
jgi:hypothetical protein